MTRTPIPESQHMHRNTLELRFLDNCPPSIQLHAHPFYEIFFFQEGHVDRYVVGSKSYHIRPGDVLMLPPGIPHHPVFRQTP